MSGDDYLARLEAAAQKAREFDHTIGERTYTLRIPTRTEVRECVHEHALSRAGFDAMTVPLLRTYLLRQALVAWTGVRESDVAAGASSAPLPWSARAAALLLDARPDDADALGALLMDRADRRDAAIEADAKNSPPASSSPAAPTRAEVDPPAA